ncbi:hypothetical protein OXX69_000049 [Metschnikowia pulcherrima]
MSNLSSTSTEPHEEAVTSFVHSVRKYELKDQMYPLVGHMDYVHEFAASTTVVTGRPPSIVEHLDSNDYDASDDEDNFGDISRYSDSVQRNFLKGLAESHEAIQDAFEINNTDPATFISLSADDLIADYKRLSEMADTDLVNSTEYHPLFFSLEKCVLRDIKRNHIAKAILAAADEKLFETYFAPRRRQYRSFRLANRAITKAIINYYPALNGESEYLGCTDFGYSINSTIRIARSMSQKAISTLLQRAR